MTREAEIEGAIGMARHWISNPGSMADADFQQVCRELYTVSVALIRVTNLDWWTSDDLTKGVDHDA